MKKVLFLILFVQALLLGFMRFSHAQESSILQFNGQLNDHVYLDKMCSGGTKTITVNSTCERQVPNGSRQECRTETRYRNECYTTPGQNICRTETQYENQCRQEVRYENVCRQVITYENECRMEGGGIRCEYVAGRRVCRQEPPRRECHQVPRYRQECHQVPRYEQVCNSVPVSRQVCEWQAGQQQCNNVPYQEQVCNSVPNYRTETYACQKQVQVPAEDTRVNANVDIGYQMPQGVIMQLQANLLATGKLQFIVQNISDPAIVLYVQDQTIVQNINGGVNVTGKVNIIGIKNTDVINRMSLVDGKNDLAKKLSNAYQLKLK